MKAKNVSGQAPGGKRAKLAEILPLDTPLVIQFFPAYACNFKCKYCTFSADVSKRGFISNKTFMELGLYKKCIDEIAQFPQKVKTLRFVGMGEPFLHKDIAKIVEYAVLKQVANKVEILTNGSLLTAGLSDTLITAGLSRLFISLQGITREKYKQVCSVDIDFKKFLNNLQYFYDRSRNKTEVHIKIIDCALDDEEEKKLFFKLFGDMCDTIGIEYAGPIFPGVDYDEVLKSKDAVLTQFGLPVSQFHICPQPFFTLQINPDGNVVPCYSVVYPEIIGNCYHETINQIWNGENYRRFRRKMLDGAKQVCKTCEDCNISKHRLFPEDNLHDSVDRLKKLYESTS